MQGGAARIAGGLALLVAVWIGVYWWWPSEPKISFVESDDSVRGVTPNPAPALAVEPPHRVGQTGSTSQNPVRRTAYVPPTPAAQPLRPAPQVVIPPEFTQHTVQRGETLETIARKYYASAALSSAIARANPLLDPTRLTPGRVIRVPKDPANIQGIPIEPVAQPDPQPPDSSAQPAEEYTVQPGDSLSKIASELYGDSRLSSVIFEANRDRLTSENAIKAGQKLRVPPRPAP